jgi:nanoRNase/pAp phosphatase (c-di-AMP/oligoRNAs hydrolase)
LNISTRTNPLAILRKAKDALVVTHRNADVDAVASAVALKMLTRGAGRGRRVVMVAPEGASAQSRKVFDRYADAFLPEIPQKDFDFVIITDTGHSALLSEQTDKLRAMRCPKVLVDHHPPDESMKEMVDRAIVDVNASSASELVYRLAVEAGLPVRPQTAQVLLLGIMADSQFLTLARNRTIGYVNELCHLGADIEKARSALRVRRDISESIARAKAARRAAYYRAQDWLVGVSTVGSFQASVARSLIDLGADISLAVGEAEGETRASMRCTQIFKERTGLHLGTDFCKELAERMGGSGGGHPTAASMNVKLKPEAVIVAFKEKVEQKLGTELKEIT